VFRQLLHKGSGVRRPLVHGPAVVHDGFVDVGTIVVEPQGRASETTASTELPRRGAAPEALSPHAAEINGLGQVARLCAFARWLEWPKAAMAKRGQKPPVVSSAVRPAL
jgi:hypothetical protein